MPEPPRTRVLIVDDSAIVRRVLTDTLSSEPDLEVVGTAPDPYVARDKILALDPDVLTLDIEMPRMDGLTFLRRLMRFHPMPVIVISSLGQASCRLALEALHLGAVEVIAKPGGPYSVGELRADLPRRIRAAACARVKPPPEPVIDTSAEVAASSSRQFSAQAIVAIGASTGGTEAIETVLRQMPAAAPAIVIAQHIPAVFSRAFAERLNRICPIEVMEATDGAEAVPGRALIAPGDLHMTLERVGGRYLVAVKTGPRVCYQRPSVDVLFRSVAEAAGRHAAGALLTGMGKDGAEGLLAMRRAGAHTIAQDESSSVVFGMPREAILLGAAAEVAPLGRVAQCLLSALRAPPPPQTSTSSQVTTRRS